VKAPARATETRTAATAKRRSYSSGRPFRPGVSGTAGDRPNGIANFSILRLGAEALTDQTTRADAIARL